jgi:hypothetical protein
MGASAPRAPEWTFGELLQPDGTVAVGRFEATASGWQRFEALGARPSLSGAPYGVPLWPIDVHCHGVGRFDFTDIPELALGEIEQHLEEQGIWCVLTLYLPREGFDGFLKLMEAFAAGRKRGIYRSIRGVALEGPFLASHGGTPRSAVWRPTRREWQRLAACGELGLRYVVLSPDAPPGSEATPHDAPDRPPAHAGWIVDLLLESGIRPALGHFLKSDPIESARAIRGLLDAARRRGAGGPSTFISDHLFNDMPLAFTHCWRTGAARLRRDEDLAALRLAEWSLGDLDDRLGPVPAALIRGAHEGILTPCLNFDGEHVDLAICRRVVELLGAGRLIAITDRVQSASLGGQRLRRQEGSTLLYQSEGIVAAGSQPIDQQIDNMRSIGLGEAEIWQMFGLVPARALGIEPERDAEGRPASFSAVSQGVRHAVLVAPPRPGEAP